MTELNPFHTLYMSEKVTPREFVSLFSPRLVADMGALYQPGNIVLRGMQGSGKTMLLDLLKPEVRVAYHKSGIDFPVPQGTPFVGCGINLITSRAYEFGKRAHRGLGGDHIDTSLLFADFVNYWLVIDLLRGLETLCAGGEDLASSIGLGCDAPMLDAAASELGKRDCWFGYLDGVSSHQQLIARITERLTSVRSWVNRNVAELDPRVERTKTSPDEPLSEFVRVYREQGVIGPNVEVFAQIDQYEELHYLKRGIPGAEAVGEAMQAAVHTAMGSRDSCVSYRVGARRFAWPSRPTRLASDGPLELKRDYDDLDLDETLRESESYFAKFAQDIFRRRVEFVNGDLAGVTGAELIGRAFGKSPTKRKKALAYVGPTFRPRAPKAGEFTPEISTALAEISKSNPLNGILATAWARSRRPGQLNVARLSEEKWLGYWQRDRLDQASLQLAAMATQRMRWYGDKDILRLSSANPLAFVTLCKELFASAERNGRSVADVLRTASEPLSSQHQTAAVYEASEVWFSKIEQSEGGRERQAACARIGEWARDSLRSDLELVRPGHTGFSIDELDLHSEPELARWLREAVDHAALLQFRHTSKNGPARFKYYLVPLLCPRFQIPSTRRKEPKYVSADLTIRWLVQLEHAASKEMKDRPRTRSDKGVEGPPNGKLF